MKVIGADFVRTGTLSMQVALEELIRALLPHCRGLRQAGDVALWQAAADGQTIAWEALFGEYSATVDWPGCSFSASLLQLLCVAAAHVPAGTRDAERP